MSAEQDVPALLRAAKDFELSFEVQLTFLRIDLERGCTEQEAIRIASQKEHLISALTTLRALAALVEAQQWRPIETAPKDGTEVLLALDNGRRLSGFWRGCWWAAPGDLAFLPDNALLHRQPTHWMPLPPAPGGER